MDTKMENKKENALEIATRNFAIWNEALQTRNPEKVAELYRDDCTFMPTFPEEGKEIVGKDGVADYFSHFLLMLPLGVVIRGTVTQVSENVIRYNGLYDFEISEEGKRTIAHAKFIFEWKEENGKYGILFHGSFPIPTK